MLTDHHVHRLDDPGTTAANYFTAANAERYRETARSAGEELGVSEHVHRFTAALDVWEHPFCGENAVDDLDRYVEFGARGDRSAPGSRPTTSAAPRTTWLIPPTATTGTT